MMVWLKEMFSRKEHRTLLELTDKELLELMGNRSGSMTDFLEAYPEILRGQVQQTFFVKYQRRTIYATLLIGAGSIVVGIISMFIALRVASSQAERSDETQSATFMLEFNNELRNTNPSYSDLISALATSKPIFYPKGNFTEARVDNYLLMWELLDRFTEKGLISNDMAYDAFSYDVETAYCNPEIKDFILRTRKADGGAPDYGGFTNLARSFLREDSNPTCSPDFIDSHYEQ